MKMEGSALPNRESLPAGRPSPSRGPALSLPILFLHVLVIATCGLVYELLAGTLASYVLGDSVTQFSLVIGIYLSAMGVGAWISRAIEGAVARRFVEVELSVALLGGCSAPLLFFSFARAGWFHPVLYGVVFGIGVLVGLELPLLMRILKDNLEFKELIGRALTFDYLGALVASVLFPLLLVPKLGLVRTSLLFGLLNAAVGLWATWILAPLIPRGLLAMRGRGVLTIAILIVGFVKADALTQLAEDGLFADEIIYTKTTSYQRIVVTRGRAGFQLFLNGNLQFSSADEYRYHESLVHPAMAAAAGSNGVPKRILVLGGGDGLALREILKYPSVEKVTLVDLDPDMTRLSERFPPLEALNQHSFRDPRVEVKNQDAMIWLEERLSSRQSREPFGAPLEGERRGAPFDVAIVDFPDPNNFALGKLYTTRFYRLLAEQLATGAVVTVQSTSPLFARTSYWCVEKTIEAAGFAALPYHVAVPSFGEWGFVLARRSTRLDPPQHVRPGLRFLDDGALAALFVLPADMAPVPVEVNRLDNQVLVRYYESEWRHWD
jgi:spermidine synthase